MKSEQEGAMKAPLRLWWSEVKPQQHDHNHDSMIRNTTNIKARMIAIKFKWCSKDQSKNKWREGSESEESA